MDDLQRLADLGQKVLNVIEATERLGHTNLRHTLRYLHTNDPSGRLIKAVVDGDSERASAEVERWHADCAELARSFNRTA